MKLHPMLYNIEEESKLIPIISTLTIPKIKSEKKKYSFTTEFDCGYGVADVVFYNLDKKLVNQRYKNPSLQLKKGHIQTILAIQKNKSVSMTYLSSKLPFSESYIKYKILKYLLENEVIFEKMNKFSLNVNYRIGLKETIAIEAKLHDWKKGLYQAYRYKWFAEESYLAVYEKFISRPMKEIEQFRKLNVGLLSVGNEGVSVMYKPLKEEPYSLAMKAIGYEKILVDYFKVKSAPNV